MGRQIRKQIRKSKTASFVSVLGIIALLVFSATPALAHHKSDHTQGGGSEARDGWDHSKSGASDHDGDADSDASSTQTENDADPRENTPEGVSDAGDNKHPSGKDRSVENGRSTSNPNQGKAESNPDDSKGPMRYEGGLGDDKPNGPGGTDAADQDGNNGCGNDDDFDDDNNGWCGKKKSKEDRVLPTTEDKVLPTHEVKVCPAGSDKAGQVMADLKDCDEDEVQGRVDTAEPKAPVSTDVLDTKIRRAAPVVSNARTAPGAVLPFTGGSVAYLAAAALGLIALGTLALRLKTATNN